MLILFQRQVKEKINNSYFSCGTKILHFVATLFKCRKGSFLGGFAQIIIIVNRGVIEICYNIPIWGGGASLGNPNLYYIIYGRPLMCDGSYLMSASHNPFGIRYLFVSLFWGIHKSKCYTLLKRQL